MVFLFAAFFVAWLALLLYLWNLFGQTSALRRELEAFEREFQATVEEALKTIDNLRAELESLKDERQPLKPANDSSGEP